MARTNTNTGGGGGGTGTVLTVSVASLNGFSGISDGNPANPTLTLSTTETGMLFGDGTAIAAVPDGLGGQVLTTDGAGNYSFGTVPNASLVYKQVAYGDSLNVITSDGDFTRDPTAFNTTLLRSANGGTFGALTVAPGVASLTSSGTGTVASATSGAYLDFPVPGFSTTHNGFLVDGTGSYIKTSTGLATTIAKWPTTHGAAGEVLTDDGSGTLYWDVPGGGGFLSNALTQYHIFTGDASNVAVDSGTDFLWNPTDRILQVGDLGNVANGTKLILDDLNQVVTLGDSSGGFNYYPSVDQIQILSGGAQSPNILLDGVNNVGHMTIGSARPFGLYIDTNVDEVSIQNTSVKLFSAVITSGAMKTTIGEVTNPTSNQLNIELDDQNSVIKAFGKVNGVPLSEIMTLDAANNIYSIGDLSGSNNSTIVSVDDLQQTVFLGATSQTFWQIDVGNLAWTGMLGGNASMLVETVDGNTFLGYATAGSLTTGVHNSVYGALAGGNLADGSDNSFFGWKAGSQTTSGFALSAFGEDAGTANVSGNNSSYFGRRAGFNDVDGINISIFGAGAGQTIDSGSSNITLLGVGADVLASGTTNAVAIGVEALTRRNNIVAGSVASELSTFAIGIGLEADSAFLQSTFGTFRLTDYADSGTQDTDGNGNRMKFHYGNNTGNGLQGQYVFEGAEYNIGDVSGNNVNGPVEFQMKSGSTYLTSDASVNVPIFIQQLTDGGYEVHWHITAHDVVNEESATWEIVNGLNVASAVAVTMGIDTILSYGYTAGASTWNCETQTSGADGYGLKLAGQAATDIRWTVRWDITFTS